MGEDKRQVIIGAVAACVLIGLLAFALGVTVGCGEALVDTHHAEPAEFSKLRDREYAVLNEIHNDVHAMRDDLASIRKQMPRRGLLGDDKE